jgi:hypothetical protein
MKKINSPKVMKMNQIHRENEHLNLMWVPGHSGIQGNEKADQYATPALKGEIAWTYKTVPDDWKNWIKKKQHERIQGASSENPMLTLTTEIKRNNNTQTLTRRAQVIVSRLRMGYTRLTHGHRVDVEPPPDCGCRLIVNHIL